MNIEDFSKKIIVLGSAYGKTINKSIVKTWYMFFKDTNEEDFNFAIRNYIENNKFFPTICDIKQIINKKNHKELSLNPDEEWEKVISAIRKYGYYDEDKALNELESVTREIVKRIGYKDLCSMEAEKKQFMRSSFIKAFNNSIDEIQRYAISDNHDSEELKEIENNNKETIQKMITGMIKEIEE